MTDVRRPWPLRTTGRAAALLAVWLVAAIGLAAQNASFPVPDHSHKCPVCGMVVHRYPDFLASVTYSDGETAFFDGAKDLFKYLFDLARYAPHRRREDIRVIRVTEYYELVPLDARAAVFVTDSDVYGPMGKELIPFRSESDALAFKSDHDGRRVLRFQQVTPAIIKGLD